MPARKNHVKGKAAAKPPAVKLGNKRVKLSQLRPMVDSGDLLRAGKLQQLYARLDEQGYLLLKGGIEAETARSARVALLEHIHKNGQVSTEEGNRVRDGRIKIVGISKGKAKYAEGCTVDAMTGGMVGGDDDDDDAVEGWEAVGNSKALCDVYRGRELSRLLDRIFRIGYRQHCSLRGDEDEDEKEKYVLPLPHCTWLRVKGRGSVTAEHADYSYFRDNTNIFRSHMQLPEAMLCSKSGAEDPSYLCAKCRDAKNPFKDTRCSLCHRKAPPSKQKHQDSDSDSDEDSANDESGEWHCDSCSDQFFPYYTCWVSLSEIAVENSTLAMMPKSQNLPGFNRGYDTLVPIKFSKFVAHKDNHWEMPSKLSLGDVLIFNVKTVHSASLNSTDFFRVSLDTRIIHKPRLPAAEPMYSEADTSISEEHYSTFIDSGSSSDDDSSSQPSPPKKRRLS
jgi:hypothetical protein